MHILFLVFVLLIGCSAEKSASIPGHFEGNRYYSERGQYSFEVPNLVGEIGIEDLQLDDAKDYVGITDEIGNVVEVETAILPDEKLKEAIAAQGEEAVLKELFHECCLKPLCAAIKGTQILDQCSEEHKCMAFIELPAGSVKTVDDHLRQDIKKAYLASFNGNRLIVLSVQVPPYFDMISGRMACDDSYQKKLVKKQYVRLKAIQQSLKFD